MYMKKINLTNEVLAAIHQWYNDQKLTYEQIGEIIGVNKSSVCAMLSGKTATMSANAYSLLYPHIQKYLPDDYKPVENSGALVINNGGTNYGNAVNHYALSVVLRKITDSDVLTADEKIKFIKVLQGD
jgi:predicted XRE-type DNA-binding protein